MTRLIDINTAKEQLIRIDAALEGDHLLIGGLAVQQYHKTRDTRDIDLVCERETARRLVELLYPSKDYQVEELNDDEYRPSYVITNKVDRNRIVFFGPKILERPNYNAIDWIRLAIDSRPFRYKNADLKSVKVPCVESLAFMKLLSFVDRISKNTEKGQNDLVDFVNLTNSDEFRFNVFINFIRESRVESYLSDQISKLQTYDKTVWGNSLFMDFASIIAPFIPVLTRSDGPFDDNSDKLFHVGETVEFFDIVAPYYDARNTNFVLEAHRTINRRINRVLDGGDKTSVLDLGSGTGRLIASHYLDNDQLEWHCVEPSSGMREQFRKNFLTAGLDYEVYDCSIFDLSDEVRGKKYNIIIVSLVISTVERDPDFSLLYGLLAPGGVLIVADFLDSSLLYDVNTNEGKFALKTRKISIIDLLLQCKACGFEINSVEKTENPKNEGLTFIIEFLKP